MIKSNKRISLKKDVLESATKFLLSVFVSSFVKVVFVVIAARTFFRIEGGKSVEKLLDVTTWKLSSLS